MDRAFDRNFERGLQITAFCLDIKAILTVRDDELGEERIARLLEGQDSCFVCFITRMEVLSRVWKEEGEMCGRFAYEQLQSLPIQWVDQAEPLLLEASRSRRHVPFLLRMPGSSPRL